MKPFDGLDRPIWVFDYEVFAYDWIIVAKVAGTDQYFVVHNDSDAASEWMKVENPLLCGYNNKGYDQFVHRGVLAGFSEKDVKRISDEIVVHGKNGWEIPALKDVRIFFDQFDLMDDVRIGISLKEFEAHLGMGIKESSVPFDIDRPLTAAELESVIDYCKHDVDAAESLLELRRSYLQTKINLGIRAGITPEKALYCTNAKLTAILLGAKRRDWHDGRNYVYPPNLDLDIIPQELKDFYDTIHDETIPDAVLFKTQKIIVVNGLKCTFAWGGVHGSVERVYYEEDDEYVIRNKDVSSLYPSLLELYDYLSRNVTNREIFGKLRRERIEAKHRGDKQTASDLKLPLNTTSGAQENRYNDLYDPLPTRSLRISGQLFLLDLVLHLEKACPSFKMLNFNTDGVMYRIKRSEETIAEVVAGEWEARTGFELETDAIRRVWIKDVNNLLIEKCDGKIKKVGGYLNWGISTKGAMSINNKIIVVKKALIEYLVNGTPPEKTVAEDDNMFDFQIIAKAGSTYESAYHIVGGEPVPVQKVNRVYASLNPNDGRIMKKHRTKTTLDKIADLPGKCFIDNEGTRLIEDVDKQFYVDMAWKYIRDYLPAERKKKDQISIFQEEEMATTKPKEPEAVKDETPAKKKTSEKPASIYERLAIVRQAFRAQDIKQSGLNTHADFTYFELPDIIPTATELLTAQRLVFIVNFPGEYVVGDLIDIDDPSVKIAFVLPFAMIADPAKFRMNEVQGMGAAQTYYRRYMYYQMLDICNKDEFDGGLPTVTIPTAPETPKIPATPEERKVIAKDIVNLDGPADELQIKSLKLALKKLKDRDPANNEYVQKIALKTKSFTEVSKTDCSLFLKAVQKKLAEGDEV